MSDEGIAVTSDVDEMDNLATENDEVVTQSDSEIAASENEPENEIAKEPEPENEIAKEPEQKKPKKNKKTAKERISQLTYERREAERQLEAERLKREELEKKLAEVAESSGVSEESKLNEDDFDSYDEYIAAVAKESAREELEKIQGQKDAERQQQKQKSETNDFKSRLDQGLEKYDDFQELVFENTELAITPPMVDVMKQMDEPAEIAYALAKDPDLATEIAGMNPTQIAMKFGAIEARLTQPEPEPEKKTVTKAPKPITPVKGGGVKVTKDPDKMTPAEYRAWRQR